MNILPILKKFSDTWKITRNNNEWFYCRKKPIMLQAIQMQEDFLIETLEGTMTGRNGDYVIKGIDGEIYCCKKDIFERTYRKVKK